MGILLLLLGAIHVAGLLFILFAVAKAPYGYEDEKGFHKADAEPVPATEEVA
jgi:hypothetical protein